MLYNDYRPKQLNDMVGQNKIVADLKKRFKERKIPQVILLSGMTGVGKTTLQRIIGKALACNNIDEDGNPCGECAICNAIDKEEVNNFYFELNASNLNIDEVRKLVQDAEIKNFSQAKVKVFVIDELQEMKKSQAALSNLLKPLERDYNNVYFVLGTMSEKDIPSFIKNRCVVYNLKELPFDDIVNCLTNICEKENIKIETQKQTEVLFAIADHCNGSLRTAISYLDRVINSNLWSVNELKDELNILSSGDLVQYLNQLLSGDKQCFDFEISKEFADKIRFILGLMYKCKIGVAIPFWQTKNLKLLNIDISIDIIQFALQQFFKLSAYPYISNELFDFTIIEIFNFVKNKKY
jgi:DNA polymerase-3 subunit gamma/tau